MDRANNAKWIVTGPSKATGRDMQVIVEASRADEAESVANAEGLMVRSSRLAPLPQMASTEIPTKWLVVLSLSTVVAVSVFFFAMYKSANKSIKPTKSSQYVAAHKPEALRLRALQKPITGDLPRYPEWREVAEKDRVFPHMTLEMRYFRLRKISDGLHDYDVFYMMDNNTGGPIELATRWRWVDANGHDIFTDRTRRIRIGPGRTLVTYPSLAPAKKMDQADRVAIDFAVPTSEIKR